MFAAVRRRTGRVSLLLCTVALLCGGCRKKPTEAHFRLENGLRVDLLGASKGDKAAMALLFDVGADNDPPGRSGMAHLVERLFATSGRSGQRSRTIDQMRAQYGNDWHADTGADYTVYAVEVAGGKLMDELDDAALRMSSLWPTDADLNRERGRLLGDLATMQEHDAASAAMLRAAESLHPTRGNGLRGGVPAEIEALTLDELEAFRKAHYGGATARLVVAGNFDVGDVTKRIQSSFAKVPSGKAAPARSPSGAKVTGTLVMGDAPSAVALAVPVPEPKDPIYPALLVLAARIADSTGGGRSWKSDFAPLARPDTLFVTSAVPAGQPAEPFAAQMRADVNKVVGAPLGGDEAEHAVARFGAALGMTPATADTIAADPFQTAFAAGRRAQLGIDGAALAAGVAGVTPQQLGAAAKLFDDKSSAAVIAGGKI
jgi:zinc protease